jgi:transcriptional repressor NrdR
MQALKGLDDVAYVRFASVYKNFREAQDFKDLLGTLGAVTAADPETVEAADSDAPARRPARRTQP